MNRLIYYLLSSKFGARLEIQILMRQTSKAFHGDGDASKSPLIRKRLHDCQSRTSASISRDSHRAEKSGVWAAFASARLSNQELLDTYARFSADAARRAIDSGQDMKQLHHSLYHMAFRLGIWLRRWLRPKDNRECQAVIALLYRNIGIRMKESSPGEFTVQKCYFSTFYTPDICAVISAIDQGVFAGIYQKGTLTFRERITEGRHTCKAFLFNK